MTATLDCCELFDCPFKGQPIEAHCHGGCHCVTTTASCAAEWAADDHPNRCCDCNEVLR